MHPGIWDPWHASKPILRILWVHNSGPEFIQSGLFLFSICLDAVDIDSSRSHLVIANICGRREGKVALFEKHTLAFYHLGCILYDDPVFAKTKGIGLL